MGRKGSKPKTSGRGEETATAKKKSKKKSKTKRSVNHGKHLKSNPTVEDGSIEDSDTELDEENLVSFENLNLSASSLNFVSLNRCTLLAAVPADLVCKGDKRVSLWF